MNISFKSNSFKKELFSCFMNFKYAVRLDKPLLTLRIIRDYLQLLLFRKVPLRYVDIAVDYRCNLRCIHCSAEKLKKEPDVRRMDIDDYRKLARQCHELGVITVGITGGEPLLYPRLEQVIKAFKPGRTMISLKTNATLLTDDWLVKLRKWKVDSISIGLGPVPDKMEEYDGIRGVSESYRKSLDAVKKAMSYGFRVIVGVVVSHENIHSQNVENLLDLTATMGVILILGLAVPAGNWQENRNIILTEEDRKKIREILLKYKHVRTDFESNFITRGCGAINEKVYITAYGDVMPCPFVQIGFGNVLKEPLAEIRNKALSYPVYRGYPDRCLAADNYDFIDECLRYTFDAKELPVTHNNIPEMSKYDRFGHKTH